MRSGVRFALDLGAVRIGVAKSDPTGTLASPFSTWPTDSNWIAAIDELIREYEPLEILIGYPRNLQGESAQAAQNVRGVVQSIRQAFPNLAIRLVDERMTTSAARKQLQAAGYNSRTDKSLIDAAAATVLLEDALEAERRQGQPPGELV